MTNTPLVGMRAVVLGQVPHDLQPHGRLAGPFFAEHDRRGRLGRIAVDLVPGRMVRAGDAVFLEDRIGLRVFFGERIACDAVMFEKLLRLHAGDAEVQTLDSVAAAESAQAADGR